MNTTRAALSLLCVFTSFACAIEPPIDVDQVAKAFSIPVSGIRWTSKTEEVAAKYGDAIYSASLFEFDSEPTVTMQVIVTKGHFLLTDILRGRLEADSKVIEKVDLEKAGIAFIGIEGFGPGGEGYVAIAHLPSHNLDFRLRVMLSNDNVIDTSSTLRSGLLLKQALRTLAISSNTKLSQMNTPVSSPATKGTPPVKLPASPSLDTQLDQKATKGQDFQPTQTEPKPKTWVIYSLAIFSLGLCAVYRLWRKRRFDQEKSSQR